MRKRGGGAKGEFIVCGNRVVALSRKPRTDYHLPPPLPTYVYFIIYSEKRERQRHKQREGEEDGGGGGEIYAKQ